VSNIETAKIEKAESDDNTIGFFIFEAMKGGFSWVYDNETTPIRQSKTNQTVCQSRIKTSRRKTRMEKTNETGKLNKRLRRISLITAIGITTVTAWSIVEAMTCGGFLCGIIFLIVLFYVSIPGTAFLSLLFYARAYLSASHGGNEKAKRLLMLFFKYTVVTIATSIALLFLQSRSIRLSEIIYSAPIIYLWILMLVSWVAGLFAMKIYLFIQWRRISGLKWPLLSLVLPIVGAAVFMAKESRPGH